MKVIASALVAAGCLVTAYVVYEIRALRNDSAKLDSRVNEVSALLQDVASKTRAAEATASPEDLSARIARIEEEIEALRAGRKAPPEEKTDLGEVQGTLASLAEEIAEIRRDLEGVRKVRSALDNTADRFLGALIPDADAGQGGRQGGLDRLMELGSLFQRRPEELTPEERARRDEIASQLQRRRDEWMVAAFDRSLTTKLDDGQKASLQKLLEEERVALEGLRSQGLTEEASASARKEIRSQTDARAAEVLSPEQYESWKAFRARTAGERGAGAGRFGRGR